MEAGMLLLTLQVHRPAPAADEGDYEVAQALFPVAPRVGEEVWVQLSAPIISSDPISIARFRVDEVSYGLLNTLQAEAWMYPFSSTHASYHAILQVAPLNEATAAYVERVIAAAQESKG